MQNHGNGLLRFLAGGEPSLLDPGQMVDLQNPRVVVTLGNRDVQEVHCIVPSSASTIWSKVAGCKLLAASFP